MGERLRGRTGALAALAVVSVLVAFPGAAQAHGPIAPAASSYLAKVLALPAGLQAKVVDGDLRMWLQVPRNRTVIVLDYRGAPYLRYSPAGIDVNQNSSMYYLNQTPVALTPPANLTASTPPSWHRVSGGRSYEWHDGRLHALAAVALSPGTSFVGRWRIPLRIDGQLSSISGGLWHADAPTAVWFWPIVVIVACVLAAWRLRRAWLDRLVARVLAVTALIGMAIVGFGLQLHGRPTITVFQFVELAAILTFVGWGLSRTLFRTPGYFTCFLIGGAALWAGGEMITTLLYGFVLIPLPAFLARTATVVCLGTGVGLLLLVFRLADHGEASAPAGESLVGAAGKPGHVMLLRRTAPVALAALTLLSACGSTVRTTTEAPPPPAALVAQARPIGRGPSFQPPARGPVVGACERPLGPRNGVHVEVFAANRVVLLPVGIGTKPPRSVAAGRISSARCYGDLVTLDPTGLVLVRRGTHLKVADVFRAWGEPLSTRRLASFSAPPGTRVAVFVDGRKWRRSPASVPLSRHAEIVLEVGPHVAPHPAYTFPPGT